MAKCKNCTRLYRAYDEKNEVLIGKWCDKVFDCPDVEEERECIHYKCMTNADRIRRMTDEELADFIACISHYCDGGQYMVTIDGVNMNDYKNEIMEWLQEDTGE